jgi:hypothetical protein
MTFDIKKYSKQIKSIIDDQKNPQESLDEWVMTSPSSGKEYAKRTRIQHQLILRKFLKDEFNFEYNVSNDDIQWYKNVGNEAFEKSPVIKVDLKNIESRVERLLIHTESFMNTITQKDIEIIQDTMISNKKGKTELLNKIDNIIFILLVTSGRRFNEFYDKIDIPEGKTDENVISYTVSKKRGNVVSTFKPALISVDEWVKLYKFIIPLIRNTKPDTINRRMNHYMNSRFPDYTTHTLRKIYAELCVSGDKSNTRKIVKIKKCLDHDSLASSERYVVEASATARCDVCGVDVKNENFKRHEKTLKHQFKLNQQ